MRTDQSLLAAPLIASDRAAHSGVIRYEPAAAPRREVARFARAMPSTVIRSFAYRAEARELEVLFTTGRRYLYREVPAEAAEALRGAFAKGRHFNARIRGRYPYRELERADEAIESS